MDIKSKKITVLGAGRSGISAAKLASYLGGKVLISDIRLDIQEINIEKEEISREKLLEITGGMSVPQIVINGEAIGGYTELVEMYG